jgi:hypothetical protein
MDKKAMTAHAHQFRWIHIAFFNFVKPDYAAESSWQQIRLRFVSLHLAARFRSVPERADNILKPVLLQEQGVTKLKGNCRENSHMPQDVKSKVEVKDEVEAWGEYLN